LVRHRPELTLGTSAPAAGAQRRIFKSSVARFILTSSVILSLGTKWKIYPFKIGCPHALYDIICSSFLARSPSEKSVTSLAMDPSVPTQQFFSHRTYFREISYFGICIKICRNIRILSKSDLNNRQFTRRLTFSPGPICATVETGEIQERCEISRNRIHERRVAESPMCTFVCCVRNTSHCTK